MKLFFIRHKTTYLYIQRADGPKGKGGSWLEPGLAEGARVFYSLRACRGFMANWLRGISEGDHGDGTNKLTPVVSRRAEDFEIVEKEIDLGSIDQKLHSASSPVPAQHISHRH